MNVHEFYDGVHRRWKKLALTPTLSPRRGRSAACRTRSRSFRVPVRFGMLKATPAAAAAERAGGGRGGGCRSRGLGLYAGDHHVTLVETGDDFSKGAIAD